MATTFEKMQDSVNHIMGSLFKLWIISETQRNMAMQLQWA